MKLGSLLHAAWRYRGFVVSSVANEFKSRLSRSRFGTAWVVLQPLATVLIFTTILSGVLAAKLQGVDNKHAYAVFLMSGILCWSLFAEIVQRCTTVFIDNGSLLKKMQFPRIVLPIVSVGAAAVGNLALLVVMLVILPFIGFLPTVHLLWLPLLMLVTIALATGIGLFLGTLNVFVRDVGQVVVVLIQFWFWVTPIVYPPTIVPEHLRSLLYLNPVVALSASYQDVLVYGRAPDAHVLGSAAFALVMLGVALFLFRRASAEMVDVL